MHSFEIISRLGINNDYIYKFVDIGYTWLRLFQKLVVRNKFDIYVYIICNISIMVQRVDMQWRLNYNCIFLRNIQVFPIFTYNLPDVDLQLFAVGSLVFCLFVFVKLTYIVRARLFWRYTMPDLKYLYSGLYIFINY